MNEELRLKLFNLFSAHALKICKEYLGGDYNAFEYIALDMESIEWNSFNAKWKRHLIKNKINRIFVEHSFLSDRYDDVYKSFGFDEISKKADAAYYRDIPGFYSILDPVSQADRSRKNFVLDIPKELGDKILILGFVP